MKFSRRFWIAVLVWLHIILLVCGIYAAVQVPNFNHLTGLPAILAFIGISTWIYAIMVVFTLLVVYGEDLLQYFNSWLDKYDKD